MVSAIRHVGIVVRDINKSSRFYADVLGLKVYMHNVEEGEFIETLTGLPGVKLEYIKFIIPKGGLIELLQYHRPTHEDAQLAPSPSRSNTIGCSHIALTVADLEATYKKVQDFGCTAKSAPLMTANGKAKILYCHDPDGVILELIEDIKQPA